MDALRILAVAFGADTSEVQKGLKQIDASVTQTKGLLGTLASSLLSAFSFKAIAGFVHEQIELGDALVDTATKLGVCCRAAWMMRGRAAWMMGITEADRGCARG